jgi:hypothetical protein
MEFYTNQEFDEMIDQSAEEFGLDRDQVAGEIFENLAIDIPGYDYNSISDREKAETFCRNYARQYEQYLVDTSAIRRWVHANIAPLPSWNK